MVPKKRKTNRDLLECIESKVSGLNGRIDGSNTRIDGTNERVDDIHTRLDDLRDNINTKFEGHNDYHINYEKRIRKYLVIGGVVIVIGVILNRVEMLIGIVARLVGGLI